MPAQSATKATIPVGSDGWNPVVHLKQLSETTRSVIPVADQAERDALAGRFPGGVLPVPTLVARLDIATAPVQRWDGAAWSTTEVPPLIRQGVTTVTTNSAGYATLTFTKPFPGGLTAAVVNDYSPSLGAISIKYISGNASSVDFRCFASTGATINTTPVQVIYIATGY